MAILERLSQQRTAQENGRSKTAVTQAQELARRYRDRLISELPEAELDQLVSLPPRMRESKIAGWVTDMMREEGQLLPGDTLSEIIDIVQNEMVGLGPLQPLLRDSFVTEIMVNWVRRNETDHEGYSQVYIERNGLIQPAPPDIRFENQAHLRHIIDRIVSPLGRRIDEASPRVDARLPEGHRVNAIIPPLAVDGPILTIRKFRKLPFTDQDLVERYETLTVGMMTFLRACVRAKLNILVSGGTGSGKTTTLNVLSSFIAGQERIVTIEDAAELRFHESHPHVVRLEARPPNVEGEGEVTIRELVKNALRMRPDRIIVGEVRSGEALDMLQAMNTGHEGSMTTVHANSTYDAFSRLENMVMLAESARQLPLQPIREQLASAIHIVVQQSRLPGGKRKIVSISEVQGLRKGQVALKDIFLFQQTGVDENGMVQGYFSPTGVIPTSLSRLREALPAEEAQELEGIFSLDYFFRELGGELLNDKSISEIMINSPEDIYVEQYGRLRKLPLAEIQQLGGVGLRHARHLEHIVETIAARLGRRVDEQRPMVDARLPDGSRVNAILPPLALSRDVQVRAGENETENSPVITIRRFPKPLAIADLLQRATLTEAMTTFLQACIQIQLNILISGGTGSGKTTLLNVLSQFLPGDQRIITIEDVAELQLKQPHWVRLESRPTDEYGEGEVTIRDLVRNSLRMRPDRIIVGECRGAEALDMLQAMNTGHSGSMTTLHANSPLDAFYRLETMTRMAVEARELSSREIRAQMGVLDLVVQVGRLPDGSRKLVSIAEIAKHPETGLSLNEIFSFKQTGMTADTEPRVIGRFQATGHQPAFLERIQAYGISLPEQLFDPAAVVDVYGESWGDGNR
jgi:pilus assembly protein CpaF